MALAQDPQLAAARRELDKFPAYERAWFEWEYDSEGKEYKVLVVLVAFEIIQDATPYGDGSISAEMRAIRDTLIPRMKAMGLHRIRIEQIT